MKVIKDPKEMQHLALDARRQGKIIGFVPTMGYFHSGHLSLMRRCRKECDWTVVSIFVNPLQFGPREDLETYPRDLDRDLRLAAEVGIDVAFVPEEKAMYPPEYQTYVEVTQLTRGLEGFYRPGHFRGVTTVVLKLFNIVQPDFAYFGQKDYQQLKVIERMVQDLNIPVRIVACETVREPDGLAMSSRNVYLNPDERRAARVLYRSLEAAREALKSGTTCSAGLKAVIWGVLSREQMIRPQYVEIVDPETLEPVDRVERRAVVLLAAFVGQARLIDEGFLEMEP
ncbi:MAG: pantoate--beta-alanine ligase [Armatimonadetes bacterium]|nr:pantoate--beta-alanine ligase [Armatimonadota bacterium]MDW8122932.1 pantoate--beta-alanine ligase [Armatimonadota bacterium]